MSMACDDGTLNGIFWGRTRLQMMFHTLVDAINTIQYIKQLGSMTEADCSELGGILFLEGALCSKISV